MFKQKTYRVATIYQYKKSQDISAPDTVQYVAVWKYPGALVFYISFRKFLLKSLFLDMWPDVDIVDQDVVEVAALLVAEEGVWHPHLRSILFSGH